METKTDDASAGRGTSSPAVAGDSPPIVVRGLSKIYRRGAAVDGIDMTVEAGDVYGFLGPNGAGKTTTLRMLLGLVRPDAGSIRLFGIDPAADPIRALEGVAGIIEEPRLYPYLSGRRNLELLAAFDRSGAGSALIDDVLAMVELVDRADDHVAEYSQGMRQRLGIASCLIRRPRLLLLDEPANGLDPAGISFLRDLIRSLANEGITIVLSSHLLAEVEAVCTQVAVINLGRVVYEGSLSELRAGTVTRHRLGVTDLERAYAVCAALDTVHELRVERGELTFSLQVSETIALTRALGDAGVGITSLVREEATLERLFFELTEQQSDEAKAADAVVG
jgi:ABC-2 type transport system ATP-binding protein